MKYRNSDITLIQTNKIYRFNNFIPNNNCLFLKILQNDVVVSCRGDLCKKMFKTRNRKMLDKDIKTFGIEFFSDYVYNLKEKASGECSSYQFLFQYKDSIETYSCSIYPCIIIDKCKSFDIIIRPTFEQEYEFRILL